VSVSRVSLRSLTGRRMSSISMDVFPEYVIEISELTGLKRNFGCSWKG